MTQTSTVTLTISVRSPLVVLPLAPLNLTPGQPFSVQIVVSGGKPPYTFLLHPGTALPPGVTLSGTGVISGSIAVEGDYLLSIDVGDKGTP